MTDNSKNQIAIILATGNKDKVRELRPLLENISPLFRVYALNDIGLDVEIEETEVTLEGNALLKAQTVFDLLADRFPFMVVLADDTGLEVEGLNGAPGVYSARYAPMSDGNPPTYTDNLNHLLHCMSGIVNRKARFRSVIALKGILPSPQGSFLFEKTMDGVVCGTITPEPKGSGGFGYDPIFMVDALGKTYAEMNMQEKNSMSHRSLAVKKAIITLRDILERTGIPHTTLNVEL
ncbi:MAG: RdgB/HAM1 family non-canonical purine NTP pyrophosphatase [Chlorobium sp.]|nr:MAG: RdgB/HAM1 family non-canonical purine NTP pyrophosphatase [Chlorobium sp.]